jgi:Tol biopolymer transport system component
MRDDAGVVQLWSVSPNGGPPRQITRDPWDVASAFTWNKDGSAIAYIADGSVMTVDAATGESRRLTEKPAAADLPAPRPEACVFSPNGLQIAFVRPVRGSDGSTWNQIFVVSSLWEGVSDPEAGRLMLGRSRCGA